MTSPLTPADCDLTDFAFMPLDVARLRDSELASNETPEACWAAVLLWAASWHQVPAASIPNDDKWIAKQAGYAQRGKIDKAWPEVREGALRGWVECDDGRLYHAVVAEKAVEAWNAKRDQRWRTECARIKKHNDRHHTAILKPTFEEWVSAGCPSGQRLYVPSDTPVCPESVHGETHSKGQGEGQRQGHGDQRERDTHTAGTALPEGFALPKAWGVWSIEEFAHWTPETVRAIAAQFADHHRAAGTLSLDWAATWRKWCRDDLTQRAHPAPKVPLAAAPAALAPKTMPSADHARTQAAAAEAEAERLRIAAMTPEQRAEVSRVARETSARLRAAA